MKNDTVFKIKSSIDIFLSNGRYLMVYYMNTRQKISFRVNEEMIHLIEILDGKKSLEEIKNIMEEKYGVSGNYVETAICKMLEKKIITPVIRRQNVLPEAYVEKYSRQINYFAEFLNSEEDALIALKKIIDANVVLFGCGAVGGNIALELAMSGVENFILFDFDCVESSDAARHMYYREEYLGLSKVVALSMELHRINKNVKVKCINDSLKPESDLTEIISAADIVINTMDEPYIGYTASKISRICMKENIPHYIAGGFDAHLASTGELVIPYVTPCVECYAGHFKEKLKNWKPKTHPVKKRDTEIGGLASMSLFSSSFACIEILKYIADLVPMQDNYKVRGEFLFPDMSLTYLKVNKNTECPICGGINYETKVKF